MEAAVLAIIGVVVGAALTFGFGLVTDERRRKHEMQARLLDRRLDAYASFLASTQIAALNGGTLMALAGQLNEAQEAGDEEVVANLSRTIESLFATSRDANEAAMRAAQVIAILAPKATNAAVSAVALEISTSAQNPEEWFAGTYGDLLSLMKEDIGKATGESLPE